MKEAFISALNEARLSYDPNSCGKQVCGTKHTHQTHL